MLTPPTYGARDSGPITASRRAPSAAMHGGYLMFAIRGKGQASADIRDSQFRIIVNYVGFTQPLGEPIEHIVDGDSHISDAWFAAALSGLDCDVVVVVHGFQYSAWGVMKTAY